MPGAQFQVSSASKAETGLVVMATEYGEATKTRTFAIEDLTARAGSLGARDFANLEEKIPKLPEFDNLMFKGYSRIINVAAESVETTITGSYSFGSRCDAIFDNAGDFLGPIIGKFTISIMAAAVECWWAPKIGQTMIEEAIFYVNAVPIDKHTGLYMNGLDELELKKDKEFGFHEMIGEKVAYIDPNSSQNNLVWKYRGPQYKQTTHTAYTLHVPFRFHFCYEPGFYIPAVAIPFNTLKLSIKFRPLSECYYAVGGASLTTTPTISSASILAEIVVMEEAFATALSDESWEYMYRQLQYQTTSLSDTTANTKIQFQSSIFEMFWFILEDTRVAINDWTHYETNQATATYPITKCKIVSAGSGGERVPERTNLYFARTQYYVYKDKIPETRGMMYQSFQLKSDNFGPAGSLNFTRTGGVELRQTFTTITSSNTGKMYVFAHTWNWFSIDEHSLSVTFQSL